MIPLGDRTAAVVGGGIGGLTAALALARGRASVDVYERAAAFEEVGAGLQISPNGARVLDHLGLTPTLRDVGITAQAVVPTNALTGRTIARFDLTRQLPPYRFYHRADLLGHLVAACEGAGVRLHLNAHVSAGEDGVHIGTKALHADLIIGADGIKSALRPLLNAEEESFFTGQVAWRATIPAANVSPVARIWMAPGRHVVTYPIRGELLNIVAVQERMAWAADGWHHRDDPANLRAAFADTCDTLQDVLSGVDLTNLWGLHRHPVASNWQNGQIALLGDAAHPTLPFLAQGANLAIEDAGVLAAALSQNATVEEGLQAYEAARLPRVTRAINAANANARNYHLDGIKAQIAHSALGLMGRFAPDAFLGRLSWLYDHDVMAQNYQLAAVSSVTSSSTR